MSTQIAPKPYTTGNPTFDHGVRNGISWFLTGESPYVPPTAAQIVEFVKGNVLEPQAEGFLDEEWLTDHVGFLVGWIVAEFVK